MILIGGHPLDASISVTREEWEQWELEATPQEVVYTEQYTVWQQELEEEEDFLMQKLEDGTITQVERERLHQIWESCS